MNGFTAMIFAFAGGVALFLLGMKLLSDGLKIAAGESLRNLLGRWTSSMTLGVLSGVLVTAFVQSSSAVIFATIGFVNAGLMTLAQAIYVIVGSNVGTTFTGWIIATVGLKVNLQLMSMPLLAAGMGLWLTGAGSRRGAWGQALVGFGLFFLGIDILKNTFADLGDIVPFDAIDPGWSGKLLMLLIGIALTTAMQSSSAAIAVVLTAAAGGVIPLEFAAVMVIGADIGTTSTAVLAVIGATSNAKRTASAHVLFNLISGVVVLMLLPVYLVAIAAVFGPALSVAMTIAIFHTLKKLTGMLIFLPLTARLETFLLARFRESDFRPERPRYLDNTVLETPSLAISALIFELKRIGRKTRRIVDASIRRTTPPSELLKQEAALDDLHLAVADFIRKMQSRGAPQEIEYALPQALRVLEYFREAGDIAAESVRLPDGIRLMEHLRDGVARLEEDVSELCKIADSEAEGFNILNVEDLQIRFLEHYEQAKMHMLRDASAGKLGIQEMLSMHDYIRALRRITDQLTKAARHMDNFNELIGHQPGEGMPFVETMPGEKCTDEPDADLTEAGAGGSDTGSN